MQIAIASLSSVVIICAGCESKNETSLQGRWKQSWHSPFLSSVDHVVWEVSIGDDSIIIDRTNTSVSPAVEMHDIFAVSIDSHAIYIKLAEGDSTPLEYYVNDRYDTMSLKFLDHSSRGFIRAIE